MKKIDIYFPAADSKRALAPSTCLACFRSRCQLSMSAHDIMPDSRQNDHHNGHKVTTEELKQPQIRMPKKKSILQEGISDNISVMIQTGLFDIR